MASIQIEKPEKWGWEAGAIENPDDAMNLVALEPFWAVNDFALTHNSTHEDLLGNEVTVVNSAGADFQWQNDDDVGAVLARVGKDANANGLRWVSEAFDKQIHTFVFVLRRGNTGTEPWAGSGDTAVSSGTSGFHFAFDADGKVRVINPFSGSDIARSNTGIPVGEEHCIGIVLNEGTGTLKFFLDGEADGTGTMVDRSNTTRRNLFHAINSNSISANAAVAFGLYAEWSDEKSDAFMAAITADPYRLLRESTATADAYTLTGPASGKTGAASGTFTLQPNAKVAENVTVTLSDGGKGGTFSPSNEITFTAGSSAAKTFTYTPPGVGTYTISATNDGDLADPEPLTYIAASTALRALAKAMAGNSWKKLTGANQGSFADAMLERTRANFDAADTWASDAAVGNTPPFGIGGKNHTFIFAFSSPDISDDGLVAVTGGGHNNGGDSSGFCFDIEAAAASLTAAGVGGTWGLAWKGAKLLDAHTQSKPAWSKQPDPPTTTGQNQAYYADENADGDPMFISTHTYWMCRFLPGTRQFCISGIYMLHGDAHGGIGAPFVVDLTDLQNVAIAGPIEPDTFPEGISALGRGYAVNGPANRVNFTATAVMPNDVDGSLWTIGATDTKAVLYKWGAPTDPESITLTRLTTYSGDLEPNSHSDLLMFPDPTSEDPDARAIFWHRRGGGANHHQFALITDATGDAPQEVAGTYADNDTPRQANVGYAWDGSRGRIVVSDGVDLFEVVVNDDPSTWELTKITADATGDVPATSSVSSFPRIKHLDDDDLIVLADYGDVWLYKPSDWVDPEGGEEQGIEGSLSVTLDGATASGTGTVAAVRTVTLGPLKSVDKNTVRANLSGIKWSVFTGSVGSLDAPVAQGESGTTDGSGNIVLDVSAADTLEDEDDVIVALHDSANGFLGLYLGKVAAN